MRVPASKVAPLLFCSGLCALVYQSAWLRELRLVFGASTAASAAVLAIFMGGLGAGGLWLGKRADARGSAPLALYGNLEIGVALLAAVTPPLIGVVRWIYSKLGGSVALGLGAGTVVRLVLAAVVLLPPTLLMGGTLPAAAKAVARDDDAGRRDLAALYGVNTLGAVTGAAASTFLLLEVFGADLMLWIAAALNALLGVLARALSRAAEAEAGARPDPAPAAAEAAPDPAAAPPRFVLAASAIVGFAFLLMELTWYRTLAPILGGSSYTFGLVLVLALLGVGLGGAAYAAWMDRRPATLAGLAITCALEALCLAIPFALGDRLAFLALAAREIAPLGFGALVLGWSLVAAIVVLPAAFVSGVQFPLLIALLGRGSRGVGRHVGLAYAWNTAGAILGSLAGGFGLLPALSAPGVWRAVVIILGALGAAAAVIAHRAAPRLGRAAGTIAVALAAALLLRSAGPTAVWRHAGIGAGRATLTLKSTTGNQLEDWSRAQRRTVLWEAEGVESSVAVDSSYGVAFVVNGKVDGHAVIDGGTQVMSGLVGALAVPDARRALVVGLGTGSTAGWLGAVPSIDRVDVVELEPAILRVARDAAAVNQRVLDNPKVHVTIGDAREVLLTSRDRYDLIFSEPSNPYRAGIASLFTREFYQASEERLTDQGVFLQWLQAYEIDARSVRTAFATLASVFPEVHVWCPEGNDLILMGSRAPRVFDVPRMRARVAEEPFRSALERTWRVADLEGVFAHYIAAPPLARAIAAAEGAALNTDDRNLLEFGFARNVGRESSFSDIDLWALAHTRGETHPPLAGGAVDWESVEEQRRAADVINGRAPRSGPTSAPGGIKRAEAYIAFQQRDLGAALAAWHAQDRAPAGSFEIEMIAEGLVEMGSDDALPLLDKLRAVEPTEAAALLARLRERQRKFPEATAALEAALAAYRVDPWPRLEVMRRAITDVSLALPDPALARRAYAALAEPFAARMLDDERRETRLKLAARVDFRNLCREAVSALEPHFPFRRDMLALRRECYAVSGDPRLPIADRDLDRFLDGEPPSFGFGLEKKAP